MFYVLLFTTFAMFNKFMEKLLFIFDFQSFRRDVLHTDYSRFQKCANSKMFYFSHHFKRFLCKFHVLYASSFVCFRVTWRSIDFHNWIFLIILLLFCVLRRVSTTANSAWLYSTSQWRHHVVIHRLLILNVMKKCEFIILSISKLYHEMRYSVRAHWKPHAFLLKIFYLSSIDFMHVCN